MAFAVKTLTCIRCNVPLKKGRTTVCEVRVVGVVCCGVVWVHAASADPASVVVCRGVSRTRVLCTSK